MATFRTAERLRNKEVAGAHVVAPPSSFKLPELHDSPNMRRASWIATGLAIMSLVIGVLLTQLQQSRSNIAFLSANGPISGSAVVVPQPSANDGQPELAIRASWVTTLGPAPQNELSHNTLLLSWFGVALLFTFCSSLASMVLASGKAPTAAYTVIQFQVLQLIVFWLHAFGFLRLTALVWALFTAGRRFYWRVLVNCGTLEDSVADCVKSGAITFTYCIVFCSIVANEAGAFASVWTQSHFMSALLQSYLIAGYNITTFRILATCALCVGSATVIVREITAFARMQHVFARLDSTNSWISLLRITSCAGFALSMCVLPVAAVWLHFAIPEYMFYLYIASAVVELINACILPVMMVQYLVMCHNQFHQLEVELRFASQQMQTVQAASEGQRRFVSYLAHELRTPLQTISLGITDLTVPETANSAIGTVASVSALDIAHVHGRSNVTDVAGFASATLTVSRTSSSGAVSATEQDGTVDMMHKAAEGMSTLIDTMLTAFKVDSGLFPLELQPMSVSALLTDVLAPAEQRARHERIALRAEIADGIPDFVLADPHHLAQVLRNLLSNALKFVPRDGTGTVTVKVWWTDGGQRPISKPVSRGMDTVTPRCMANDNPFPQAHSTTMTGDSSTLGTWWPKMFPSFCCVRLRRIYWLLRQESRAGIADVANTNRSLLAGSKESANVTELAAQYPNVATLSSDGTLQAPDATDLQWLPFDPLPGARYQLHIGSNGVPHVNKSVPQSMRSSRQFPEFAVPTDAIMLLHTTVEDNGCGIAPENQTRLFQPFVQVDAGLNQGGGGTGLGLYICHEIVKMHRGTLELTSEVGRGTSIHMCVPCRVLELGEDTDDPALPVELVLPPQVPACGVWFNSMVAGQASESTSASVELVSTAAQPPTVLHDRPEATPSDNAGSLSCGMVPTIQSGGANGSRSFVIGSGPVLGSECDGTHRVTSDPAEASRANCLDISLPIITGACCLGVGAVVAQPLAFVAESSHLSSSSAPALRTSISPPASASTTTGRYATPRRSDVDASGHLTDDGAHHTLSPAPASSIAGSTVLMPPAGGGASSGVAAAPKSGGGIVSASLVTVPGKVLVVDDSSSSRAMLVRCLRKLLKCEGFIEAPDGAVALSLLASSGSGPSVISLVLMDANMPVMDGFTAVSSMRRDGYTGTVIGITGSTLPEEVLLFQRAGVDLVLPKPVPLPALTVYLRKAFEEQSA